MKSTKKDSGQKKDKHQRVEGQALGFRVKEGYLYKKGSLTWKKLYFIAFQSKMMIFSRVPGDPQLGFIDLITVTIEKVDEGSYFGIKFQHKEKKNEIKLGVKEQDERNAWLKTLIELQKSNSSETTGPEINKAAMLQPAKAAPVLDDSYGSVPTQLAIDRKPKVPSKVNDANYIGFENSQDSDYNGLPKDTPTPVELDYGGLAALKKTAPAAKPNISDDDYSGFSKFKKPTQTTTGPNVSDDDYSGFSKFKKPTQTTTGPNVSDDDYSGFAKLKKPTETTLKPALSADYGGISPRKKPTVTYRDPNKPQKQKKPTSRLAQTPDMGQSPPSDEYGGFASLVKKPIQSPAQKPTVADDDYGGLSSLARKPTQTSPQKPTVADDDYGGLSSLARKPTETSPQKPTVADDDYGGLSSLANKPIPQKPNRTLPQPTVADDDYGGLSSLARKPPQTPPQKPTVIDDDYGGLSNLIKRD